MFRKITILFLLSYSFIISANEKSVNPLEPQVVLQNIFNNSIDKLIKLKNNKEKDIKQINKIIKTILLPKINISRSAELVLKKYWQDLNDKQKNIVEQYIIHSLINDYASFLLTYEDFDTLKIIVDDNVKFKGNRAKLMVKIINNSNKLNTPISFKMIKEKEWKIYDLSVSGISLMKNFSSYFNSLIKRKGVEGFIKSLENN